MGASVVSGCNAPPILELAEHVLDFMSLTIEVFVIIDGLLAASGRRNAGCDAFVRQGLAEPVAVVPLVAEQARSIRQGIEHKPGALVITHLAL